MGRGERGRLWGIKAGGGGQGKSQFHHKQWEKRTATQKGDEEKNAIVKEQRFDNKNVFLSAAKILVLASNVSRFPLYCKWVFIMNLLISKISAVLIMKAIWDTNNPNEIWSEYDGVWQLLNALFIKDVYHL